MRRPEVDLERDVRREPHRVGGRVTWRRRVLQRDRDVAIEASLRKAESKGPDRVEPPTHAARFHGRDAGRDHGRDGCK
jgi:hypothetical protein